MHSRTSTAFTADRIFTGEEWVEGYAILVLSGIIEDLVKIASLSPAIKKRDFPGHFIAPAFIDLQIYGAGGKLLAAHPGKEALQEIVRYSSEGGAAFCLPTVATNTREVFFQSIDAVRQYWDTGGESVLGLHIEGPWINPEKRGAHVSGFIQSPDITSVKELLEYGKGVIKMITLAPEVCSDKVIELILSNEVIISAGHSNVVYEDAIKAFDNGIRAVTHLFNAMSLFHHRAPGLAGATMDHNKVMASIIPDGYHVDFASIRIAKKIMGDRLFVITDAVTETRSGQYHHVLRGDRYEAAGILSGSALTMLKGLKNLVEHAGIELGEALRMCSFYPSRLMKMENNIGKIEKGFLSKLVAVNTTFDSCQLI